MSFDWMKKSVGVAVHWTSYSACTDGSHMPYQQAVENFDVDRFVSSVVEAGAGVRFLAYYNHSCNGTDDVEWKEACGYAAGISGNLNVFAQNILDIVSFTAKRYGKKLSSWWFDSSYSVDPKGPSNTVSCDMGNWQFPWDRLNQAAKSGHADCAVCFNAGIGCNFLYSPHQDYYPGETVDIHKGFTPGEVPGIIGHRWTTIDSTAWVFTQTAAERGFADMRYPTDKLVAFVSDNLAHERMSTFNMEIDQTGVINPKALQQFSKIISAIRR